MENTNTPQTNGYTPATAAAPVDELAFGLLMNRTLGGSATLTIARNARTSPEMIDRFYAAPLQGEMNIGELQSKRRPRPWE
jgi:hypothetical protein